jgi:mono/diheme cytochrome c family protein
VLRCSSTILLVTLLPLVTPCRLRSAEASTPDLNQTFEQTVKPFVGTYCTACHSGASPAAGFNLKTYTTLSQVVEDLPRWNAVSGRLKNQQMPPKAMKQPPAELRAQIVNWVQTLRMQEARRNAGDPGLVLARRLSNAEYNYTIRDLTGVDMRPTREFPVDPANTAGFDNSGESLTMSPALFNKYLQAAHEVADHMALTPDGFVFAPNPMLVETDREKFAIQRIVGFYDRQPTDYADYFQAAWRFKHRSALGMPHATVAEIAESSQVSPKYLPLIDKVLGETHDRSYKDVGPIAKLRTMWRALPGPDAKPEDVRAGCVAMRDFVVRIRKDTAMQFAAPVVKGLSPTSQPLMNWKLKQFASHRRDFDPKSLRMEDDPAPVVPAIPPYPGLGREAAVRAAALMQKSRASDPDLVVPRGKRAQYEAAFARFAYVFPDAFYIRERGRFYPDDSEDKGRLLSAGYHNVMGYYRDDTPLIELILDEKGKQQLDKLWQEFDFMADYTARTWVQYYFNQSGEVQGNGRESGTARPSDAQISASEVIFKLRDEYLKKAEASQNPVAMQAIREHFQQVNDTMRAVERMRAEAEPQEVDALVKFASRAYRRPLSEAEQRNLLAYYRSLHTKDGLTHEEAVRDSLVSVLMSPKFSYRVDMASGSVHAAAPFRTVSTTQPASSLKMEPLSDYALASRLSYFLWSSMPDDELLSHAAKGDLSNPDVFAAETRRMLKDERARDLAVEFGGNWLGFRQFEQYNSVDRQRFPTFNNDLREAMFEEPVRFLDDVVRNNRSVLDLVYGNYTFVNPVLAKHYGIPNVTGSNDHWVRIDNADRYGRGGVLPMSVFLTLNSPGLRTSPVKRGNWVVRRVIGDEIPAPPPNVPQLPDDEAKSELPVRQMLAKHRSVAFCASCHSRFDSFGLAFEGYGPVGEKRSVDLANRPVDTAVEFPGGMQGSGVDGIRDFIRNHREADFIDNFNRKLLAYSLGRSLMLSDEPLVEQMRAALSANGYCFNSLVETIVTSKQFMNRRSPEHRDQKGNL